MQAALFALREARGERHAYQVANNIKPVASTPNPDVMSGTQGNGNNH